MSEIPSETDIDPSEQGRSSVEEVVLDRPERLNAFAAPDLRRLLGVVAGLRDDADPDREGPRAVVLRGSGRAFCAGADLAFVEELIAAGAGSRAAGLALAPRLVRELTRLPLPTVAAVHGAAYGGGACLALACDHVVAGAGARLGFVFTALGLPGGDMSAPWLLARRVGTRRAWRLLAEAAEVPADEALALGLVDEVVADDEVLPRARAVAARWAAAPPFALQQTKRQVLALEGADDALLAAAAREEAAIGIAFGRPDVAARVAAARAGRR